MIVNFANFSAHDLARFNAMVDEEPSIDGVRLLKGTKVIGLINSSGYKDASLYSRFGTAVEVCPIESSKLNSPSPFAKQEQTTATAHAPLEIDFYGAPNWKAKLIGAWTLQGDGLHFAEGALVSLLNKNKLPNEIVFKNPPTDPDFMRFFKTI